MIVWTILLIVAIFKKLNSNFLRHIALKKLDTYIRLKQFQHSYIQIDHFILLTFIKTNKQWVVSKVMNKPTFIKDSHFFEHASNPGAVGGKSNEALSSDDVGVT